MALCTYHTLLLPMIVTQLGKAVEYTGYADTERERKKAQGGTAPPHHHIIPNKKNGDFDFFFS